MKVARDLSSRRALIKSSALTIGVFDGVHIGHRRIISAMVRCARRANIKSVVVTFDPHPQKILDTKSNIPSLISLKHRIALIENMGVDYMVIMKFTRSFANMAPEKFIRDILVKKLGARFIYVGGNFFFGRGASAGPKILKKLSGDLHFKVRIVKQIKAKGRIVSSSLIRNLILKGRLDDASRLLGRPVSILGTVVSGSGLARYLGYPTANVNPHHEVIPPAGVYAVRSLINGALYGGILNIGARPTFFGRKDKEPSIEVHIFDFTGDLYGKDIEIYFVKRIRPEKKFRFVADLVDQIRGDETSAREVLMKSPLQNMRRVLI